ncbi:hypothetical protein QCA50_005435 [Cerrena zonata]|uniref:Uncharacterized protein n=1 Tax=Cerrena zonata TaxID=2478898 RepID=A0AAW0GLR0_9APHY
MTIVPAHNPPTVRLPPIKKIKSCSVEELNNAILYLRLLYNPEVRGIRRIDHRQVFPVPNETGLNILKPRHEKIGSSTRHSPNELGLDEFERIYAIRWLTTLVSQTDYLAASDGLSLRLDESQIEAYDTQWELLIDEAAALLAICAGTASAGAVSRVFVFPYGTEPRVRVQVRDVPLENHDYSSVGAQTWGSACLLSELIVNSPRQFGLDASFLKNPLRILELGSGTGLVTLTVANLLHSTQENNFGSGNINIYATDFHPSVLKNLQHNISINTTSPNVQTHFLDWSQFPSLPLSSPFNEPFDLIFGADIVYEMQHVQWIHDCLQLLLRLPDNSSRDPRFHLVIPLRRTHQGESHAVDFVFPSGTPYLPGMDDTSIPLLGIVRKDTIVCESGDNVRHRASENDVVEYMHYTIAWIDPASTNTNNMDIT